MRSKAFLIIISSFFLFSCAKEHTCTCTFKKSATGGDSTVVRQLKKSLTTDAKDACDAVRDMYFAQYGSTTCTVEGK